MQRYTELAEKLKPLLSEKAEAIQKAIYNCHSSKNIEILEQLCDDILENEDVKECVALEMELFNKES